MATNKKPHVLLVPYSAQGHVFPMLKLAQKLTLHGFTVTVANLDFVHQKIHGGTTTDGIKLVSLPDSGFDSSCPMSFTESVEKLLPVRLRELLIQQQDDDHEEQEFINWVVADAFLYGAFEVAKELGIKTAALWTCSMETLAFALRIPQLIRDGTIDENGLMMNKELPISISKEIVAWNASELPWSTQPDELQAFYFHHYFKKTLQNSLLCDQVIVNSFHELEPSAFQLFPNILPIGPLVTKSTTLGGSFWLQDETCLTWLDKHPPKSVIYVAFGSITVINQELLQELAFGLEMTGRPFLWVIRTSFVQGPDLGLEFPDGFLQRVSNIGKIVEWTNQEQVLAHPSVACFLSHCGWNSVLDGLWSGVPFLCLPYFADQFHNMGSLCEGWKVGLKFQAGQLITKSEIASKVEELLNDDTIKGHATKLREIARESVNEGGSSFRNLSSFVEELRS